MRQTASSLCQGQIDPDHPVLELWQVIAGRVPGRSGGRQITLYDSVGFAVEHFSALRYIRDRLEDGFSEDLGAL